jgi:2-polyprenyl-3-methyl-5-hydroxy-6-metoxy-1,4-benzoquinol methylase
MSNDLWESVALRYAEALATSSDDVHFGVGIPGNRLLKLIPPGSGLSALDVGCGAGENLVALAHLGYSVTGIDSCASQLDMAKHTLRNHNIEAFLANRSLADFSREGLSFDLILSVGVGHFTPSPQAFLADCARCSHPSALLVLSLPHPVDMIANWHSVDERLVITIDHYFPKGNRVRDAHYWRRFAGRFDLVQGMAEYLWRPSDVVNAVIQNGYQLAGIYEPRTDHSENAPCRYRNPCPDFINDFAGRVPQYIIYVGRYHNAEKG